MIVIICSSVYNFVSAQSRDRNYVMTVEPIEGSTDEPYLYYDFSRITVDYYDGLGRIVRVKDSDSTVYNERYEYDLNGNVTEIVRGYTGNEIGSLQFSFDGNRLHSLSQSTNNFELLDTFPTYTGPTIGELTDPVVYDESGRVVEDASRGITAITYNPLNLPKKIQLGSNDAIYMTYRADGVKVSEKTEHRYVKIVERVNSDGDTVYTERGVLELVNREYYGSMVKETGRPTRIYNEMGYIDIHRSDSIEFCYFERDYLGSIRAVTDADGRLLQSVDYHVSGNPVVNVVSDRQAANRLHTGKEFQPFQGVALYDNLARYYDPIGSKFLTMDPLCEKYPNLSPYSHCANNPLSIIDPDGREIVYSDNNSIDFNHRYNEVRRKLKDKKLNTELDAISKSKDFTITIGDASLDKDGSRYNSKTNTLYIDLYNAVEHENGINSPLFILRHELDHAHADMINSIEYNKRVNTPDEQYENAEERRVITNGDENASKVLNEPNRTNHKIIKLVPVEDPTSNKIDHNN